MTLSDLEGPNCRHYALFHIIRQLSQPAASNSHYHRQKLAIYGLWRTTRAISAVVELLVVHPKVTTLVNMLDNGVGD